MMPLSGLFARGFLSRCSLDRVEDASPRLGGIFAVITGCFILLGVGVLGFLRLGGDDDANGEEIEMMRAHEQTMCQGFQYRHHHHCLRRRHQQPLLLPLLQYVLL
ncbi:hypothetical protein PINS_up020188 [Pythium insidiosum]|nr:hypothetical protein PINS_up020188 [Pythium insidiosum]